MIQRSILLFSLLVVGISGLWTAGPASRAYGQPGATFEDFRFPVDFAYATWTGSAYYRVGDRDALVLRMPFSSHTLRSATEGEYGLSLLTPLTLGFHDWGGEDETFASAAFVPGVQFDFGAAENWRLKPFAQVGYGHTSSGGDGAFIYGAGVRSLATFPWEGFEFGLGNTLMFAQQHYTSGIVDSGFSMFEIGLNVGYPWTFRVFEHETSVDTFFVYTTFVNDLDIFIGEGIRDDVSHLYQVGVALDMGEGFDIWFASVKSVGLSLAFGEDVRAIRLTGGFPF